MKRERYVARIPESFALTTFSDRIVRDALAWYRRNPDMYRVPVYEAPPGYHADGLSVSIGHAIRRAREEGTMPCADGMHARDSAVVYSKVTHDPKYREVAVHKRWGTWSFPNPEAYGVSLADELQNEVLWAIASPPVHLDFVGLKHFRDTVLPWREFAATDDYAVRQAVLDRLITRGLAEVYCVDNPHKPNYPTAALRVTDKGWQRILHPKAA